MINLEDIAKEQIGLFNDLTYWVIGRFQDGTPRPPFSEADCQERMKLIPESGTLEALRELVKLYSPDCSVCGKKATFYRVEKKIIESYPLSLMPKTFTVTCIWYCDEHK